MVWIAIGCFIMGSVAGAILMSLCVAAGNDRQEEVEPVLNAEQGK